jgi:prepilin peptidase CpaA
MIFGSPAYLWISFWLAIACFFDFKSRKVPNKVFLLALASTIIGSLLLRPQLSLTELLLSLGITFVVGSVLFALRILGGGDVKIWFAIAALLTWKESIEFILQSFIWGAVLSLLGTLVRGDLTLVLIRVKSLMTFTKSADKSISPIPFTVALLLGYWGMVAMAERGLSLLWKI